MEAPNHLTVSDWVTFLSNEKQGAASSIVNFAALLVASLAVIVAVSSIMNKTLSQAILDILVFVGVVVCVLVQLISLFREYDRAKNILKRIMLGELTEVEQISGEWGCGELNKEHKEKHWHSGSVVVCLAIGVAFAVAAIAAASSLSKWWLVGLLGLVALIYFVVAGVLCVLTKRTSNEPQCAKRDGC